ncbi:MAG: competence protein ComE, partial [Lactobacillus crispatus]|nr:competence protein ComE [Lactobacillus crispatus]
KINYYFDYRDNPLAMQLLHDSGVPYEQIKINRKYVESLAHKLEEDEN